MGCSFSARKGHIISSSIVSLVVGDKSALWNTKMGFWWGSFIANFNFPECLSQRRRETIFPHFQTVTIIFTKTIKSFSLSRNSQGLSELTNWLWHCLRASETPFLTTESVGWWGCVSYTITSCVLLCILPYLLLLFYRGVDSSHLTWTGVRLESQVRWFRLDKIKKGLQP